MGGIACQEEPAMLHWLDDETSHARYTLLKNRPSNQCPARNLQTRFKFFPNPFVWPLVQILIRPALEIEATDSRSAHAQKSEAAIVIGVNEFLGRRWGLGKNTQPGKWIRALVNREHIARNACPADTVKPVTTGNEITTYLNCVSFLLIANLRTTAIDTVNRDVFCLENDRFPLRQPRIGEVLHNFILSVNGDSFAGKRLEVDPMAPPAELHLNSVVDEALALHALTEPHFDEQVYRALFQHAGSDAFFDIAPAVLLQYDRADPGTVQKMAQDQSGRSSSNDAHLNLHIAPNELPHQTRGAELFETLSARQMARRVTQSAEQRQC